MSTDGKDVLKSLAASAKDDDPSDAAMARLDARMAALLAIPAAAAVAGGGAAAAASGGLGVTAKLAIGAAVAAAIGGGTYVAVQMTSAPEPTRLVAVAVADAAPAPPDAPIVFDAPPAPAAVDATPAVLGHGAQRPMSPEERLAWEAQELTRAQELIQAGDAERARLFLRRVDRAARRFDSKLTEERERLMIEAELKSGHRADAVKRAKAFEARFPRSLQLPRIKALLGGQP